MWGPTRRHHLDDRTRGVRLAARCGNGDCGQPRVDIQWEWGPHLSHRARRWRETGSGSRSCRRSRNELVRVSTRKIVESFACHLSESSGSVSRFVPPSGRFELGASQNDDDRFAAPVAKLFAFQIETNRPALNVCQMCACFVFSSIVSSIPPSETIRFALNVTEISWKVAPVTAPITASAIW